MSSSKSEATATAEQQWEEWKDWIDRAQIGIQGWTGDESEEEEQKEEGEGASNAKEEEEIDEDAEAIRRAMKNAAAFAEACFEDLLGLDTIGRRSRITAAQRERGRSHSNAAVAFSGEAFSRAAFTGTGIVREPPRSSVRDRYAR